MAVESPPHGHGDAVPDVTIVVTCYNEEKYITKTIEVVLSALHEAGCTHEIIVIDDVSRDRSIQVIKDYIRDHPGAPVQLVANQRNRGLAQNYVEGAFLGRGKYYRLCPGDDSEPKDALVRLFRCLGKADIIIPYHVVVGRSLLRKALSFTYTKLVNLISGYRIKYYNGLAIHLRHNVMRRHPSSYGFGFQADILTHLLEEGCSYAQILSSSVERKGDGSTALNVRNLLSISHTLLEIAIRRVRRWIYGKDWPKPVEVHIDPPTV